MQQLQTGTTLQNGRYKILSVLGQGGFGITYLACQTMLERKVAIKEFFMKELCERSESTGDVTLGTYGSRDIVNRFRDKFLKEARNISRLNHPNIIRIIDVFEENGTAYYVMEYAENGSLSDKLKRCGYLSEPEATRYILQVAEALKYIHQRKMNHLDVKPANIMLNEKDECVLIDFGVAKQYDATTGHQTSTTPVGISEGYAPMEQYKHGGVDTFSSETDIYSLGATYFKLMTGITPPSASDIYEDGVPVAELKSKGISQKAINIICKSMEGRKKDRIHDVSTFIERLQDITNTVATHKTAKTKRSALTNIKTKEETVQIAKIKKSEKNRPHTEEEKTDKPFKPIRNSSTGQAIWPIGLGVISICIVFFAVVSHIGNRTSPNEYFCDSDSVRVDSVEIDSIYFFDSINNTSAADKTFTVGGVSFTMKSVTGGTFTMGATSEQGSDVDSDEEPAHRVTLSDYYIGETEVTQALWQAVMGSNPSYFKGSNLPVETVSWDDCQEFIRKLNSMTGQKFRLPTESEWEYAARGGNKSKGYKYSGSNNIDDVAWYWKNSGDIYLAGSDNNWDSDRVFKNNCKTHPVATKSPNELGIYDMSGNVSEWCNDWYGDYNTNIQTNPTGPSTGSYRVVRGGGCYGSAWLCRVSARYYDKPDNRISGIGLRLALSD